MGFLRRIRKTGVIPAVQRELKRRAVPAEKFIAKHSKFNFPSSVKPVGSHLQAGVAVRRHRWPVNIFTGKGPKGAEYHLPKRVHPYVAGHEVGHVRDIVKHGYPKWHERGLVGHLTGGTHKREIAAWKHSPIKVRGPRGEVMRAGALGTYAAAKHLTRAGAVGVAGGAGYYAYKRHKNKSAEKGK
jgi:hypothetical protein